jgi:hypothetical protein
MNNLTKKGKQIFIISVIVAVLIITTLIIQLVLSSQNENFEIKNFFVMIIIAVLAIGSCVYVYFVYSKRKGYTKNLSKDYYEKYESIILALKQTPLNYLERKEVADDVLAILIREQENGKTVDEAISMDSSEYVKKICESYGARNKLVFNILNGIQFSIFCFTIVQLAIYIARDTLNNFFSSSISISLIVYVIILSFVILPLTKSFKLNKKPFTAIISIVIILALYITAHELLYKFGENIIQIQNYLNLEVVFISSYGIAAFWIVIMILTMLLRGFLRKKSIKSL